MYKLHCDLCGRDMSKDENTTRVTWKDNNGYDHSGFFVVRKPRKFKADICDECLEFLKSKRHYE